MISKIHEATKEFNTLVDDEISYEEGEILAFSCYSMGKIRLVSPKSESVFIKLGILDYNSTNQVREDYCLGLIGLIKKGFVNEDSNGNFLLTNKGWKRAKEIIKEVKQNLNF
jgi:hypothetical protein